MTVDITKQQYVMGQGVLFEWVSNLSNPTFYEYVDGLLTNVGNRTSRFIPLAEGESVQFEVLDDPNTPPTPAYPTRLLLTWNAPLGGASQYVIKKYVDEEWVKVATIIPQVGQTYFRWPSPVEPDQTTVRYRIYPLNAFLIEGNPREFKVFMVRRPDAPVVSLSYEGGNIRFDIG